MVKGPRRHSLVVAATDVEHKAAIVGENAKNLSRKWQKPLDVLLLRLVAVCFLKVKRVRRRSHNQVHA